MSPKFRAIAYWVWLGAYVVVGSAVAVWSLSGAAPEWLQTVGELVLALGVVGGFIADKHTEVVADPNALPARARKWIYKAISFTSAAALAATQVIDPDPVWLTAANAVLVLLGAVFAGVAVSNVEVD